MAAIIIPVMEVLIMGASSRVCRVESRRCTGRFPWWGRFLSPVDKVWEPLISETSHGFLLLSSHSNSYCGMYRVIKFCSTSLSRVSPSDRRPPTVPFYGCYWAWNMGVNTSVARTSAYEEHRWIIIGPAVHNAIFNLLTGPSHCPG